MYSEFFMLIFMSIEIVSCEKSFTVVVDTTKSMREEIDILKSNIATVVNGVEGRSEIDSYIVIPFDDADAGTPLIGFTPGEFVNHLNALKALDGGDCPENSLAGIEKALDVSKPGSNIYVFTDAYAKDSSNVSAIIDLCEIKNSRVIIFLSGVCLASSGRASAGNVDVYYDVTRACAGAVFRFDTTNLRQAFRYMKELNKVQWNDVTVHAAFSDYKQLTFHIDAFTPDFMVVMSGEQLQWRITNSHGVTPKTDMVVETRNSQVFRMADPEVGEYRIDVRSQGTTAVTFYRRCELPVKYGFSSKLPRSLAETSRRPMPGRTNYILMRVTQDNIQLKSIEIRVSGETNNTVLALEETNEPGLYKTSYLIVPHKAFKMIIKGQDTSTYQEIVARTALLVPQRSVNNASWIQPTSDIIDPSSNEIEYGTNLTVACKINGYPQPKISWEDDLGRTIPSEDILLNIPSTYISYATVENITRNSTIYCKSENSLGGEIKEVNVYVKKPYIFNIIRKPEDQTIEYGGEGKLYCKVAAYPDATIQWYHNDTEVKSSNNLEIEEEENTLLIKNMGIDDTGSYKCEVENVANKKTFEAVVGISGIEAPKVKINQSEYILKPGDWADVECRIIKGKPTPTIKWSFKSNIDDDFGYLPEGLTADDPILKIPSVTTNHEGAYRCDASNLLGESSAEVTIKVQFAPEIKNDGPEKVNVAEDDFVRLTCEVSASPRAAVRWEMSQDDVIIALDERHTTDDRHTHRFKALWKDSGNYHCIAENNLGTAEKTVIVNVLVPPYIETPKTKMVTAYVGSDVTLSCNVLYGNPAPTLKWEFIAKDSTTTTIKRGNSTDILNLKKVTRANEGSYMCIAENRIASDSIKYYLKIH